MLRIPCAGSGTGMENFLMIFGGYLVSLMGGSQEFNCIQDHSGGFKVSGLKVMMQ